MWSRAAVLGRETTLMVSPSALRRVQHHLEAHLVPHAVGEHDVQSLVDKEAQEQVQARARLMSTKSLQSNATFDTYMRYDEIQAYLKQLEADYPNLVQLQSIGKSYEGRDMTVIRVSLNGGQSPRAVLVDAGIHAREWIAPATAVYLINQLVEHTAAHRNLLDGMDWYILPLVNPDGYEYSQTKDRFWRKNRGAPRDSWLAWFWNMLCERGADVNRNFGFHWMEAGASTYPCAETFAGSKAFSEVESQNLRDFVLAQNADGRFKMYLTLHSYGPMILYPYGYDYRVTPAPDTQELKSIAEEANAAMVAAGSVPFTVENSAELYPAAGGSDDWAKGVGGIAKSYTIELHGGGRNGFDLPASQIWDSVTQTFEGLKVFGVRAKSL
ncbi:carboxypeptidase B-like [Thrips palmi]|uniref:Carboxypeptidase B-like n=1 Tax=Thrips palmi TaxID=161013 RepID=A0A6P8Z5Y3_THRPL|nr:carboxypeptidase B-like [Thrips palmi]